MPTSFDRLVVGVWASWAVLVAWEGVEEAEREVAELWAAQAADDGCNVLVDESSSILEAVDGGVEEVGQTLLEKVEGEAGEVVAMEESLSVKDATSDVGDVETSEGVHLANVATELQGVRVLEPKLSAFSKLCVILRTTVTHGKVSDGNIADNVLGLVWGVRGAAVLTRGAWLVMRLERVDHCQHTQFSGTRSWPFNQVKLPVSPATPKKDLKL